MKKVINQKNSPIKRKNVQKRTKHPKAKNSTKIPSLKLDDICDLKGDENIDITATSRVVKRSTSKPKEPQSARVISKSVLTSRISHTSILNPIIKNGPISPTEAIAKYEGYLNTYEINEINDFPEIYFIGHPETKIKINKTGNSNFGYDDKFHHYRVKVGDHIAYRFEVRSVIGKGAFGQVLKCLDHKNDKFVALKIIVNTPLMNEQGQIEASMLQYLQSCPGHENSCIMKGIDFFVFRNHICITSEILGLNLYDLSCKMRFKPFSMIQVKTISKDILTALEFLQVHNVAHCDIKPENILLCSNTSKNVRIIDFGSSCMKGEAKFEYIQSRFYRAPEVILGLKYGPPMDIWSFGCIVAEMILGHPLFNGSDEFEQMELYMEVFGMPPLDLIDKSPRRCYFFDSNYKFISQSNLKKKRRIGSVSLAALTKIPNHELIDLLSRCFEWDQDKRITPSEALHHPFFKKKTVRLEKVKVTKDNLLETENKGKSGTKKTKIIGNSNIPDKFIIQWR